MGAASKAGVLRWFAERVGREVDTVQVRPDGMAWRPGLRTVQRSGVSAFLLDGSTMRIDRNHVVLEVSGERVQLEWLDSDGVTIHVTTYSDPVSAFNDPRVPCCGRDAADCDCEDAS